MRVLLSCSLFLFVTGIEANAQIDPGVVAQANSLVPIAGVNRLVALAGKTSSAIAIPPLVRPDVSNGLQPIADPNMQNSDPTQSNPRHPEATQTGPILHGPINDGCPPCDLELRFGLGGSAERIAGEAKDTGHKDW